jgi:hypothetical protein
MHFRAAPLLGLFSALALGLPAPAHADLEHGTMYYTTFSGGVNIHKVDFSYNGSSFTLSNNTGLASTPGADGIVFTSDQQLAVGGQSDHVNKVNPTTGTFTTQSTTGPAAYHMSVAPNGDIIAASIPGTPVVFNSTLSNTGTPFTHTPNSTDTNMDTIVFDKTGQGWYTDSGAGGVGNFGKITFNFTNHTYTTTRILSNLPAAHGAAFDPYTNTIILMGDGHISQFDPTSGTIIGDITGVGGHPFGGTFDQGAVDGKGHIFAANNDGNLTFLDISGSMNVSAPNFVSTQFLAGSLDDVAPLVGLGAPTPEPSTLWMALAGTLAGLGAYWRKRRATA